ncbi:MAG: cation-translocating P-type ATPase [Pirellulales bacterium]
MIDHSRDGDVCDYCGLPLPGKSRWGDAKDSPPTAAQFCCFGCRFAAAVARERCEEGHAHWLMARLALAAFLAMNVMMFSMVLWTRDVYTIEGDAQRALTLFDQLLRYLCLVLSLPVALLLGGPLVECAYEAIRHRRLTTDVLLVLGIAASLAYSIASVVRGEGHVYFEVGCVILVAVTLGRWFEATGKHKTTAALAALERLLPDSVRVVQGGREAPTPLADVAVDDTVRVLSGERFGVDGVLLRGASSVDEQLITGESVAVEKNAGDRIYAGTLNLDGDVLVRVTAAASQGTLSRIVAAVRAAAIRKDRYQSLADHIAAWFTPLVVVVALAALVYHARTNTLADGVMAALAVVLIACPCALALATPMAIWTALGAAARQQVLFHDGDALAQLATVSHVDFDKTGTLSTGQATVEQLLLAAGEDRDRVLRVAATLASGSSHPLSIAVARYASDANRYECDGVRTLGGLGLKASIPAIDADGALGGMRLMDRERFVADEAILAALDAARRDNLAVVCIGWSGRVRGVFLLAEAFRAEVPQVIRRLGELGLSLRVLTGDRADRCGELAQIGLAVEAELLPDDKLAAVERLRRQRRGVAMVGDGVNDAPALAAADVGIAMGCGADISRASAGVCLLGNDLSRLPWAVELARRTVRTIRWNLAFAFVYNIAGIALAATGRLNPIFAAIAMTASSLLVISNSLRLTHDARSEEVPTPGVDPAASVRSPSPQSPATSPCS